MTATDQPCTFCRKPGHVEADHPLPKTHPGYDAFYDASDNELADMVSDSLQPRTDPIA